MCAIILWYTHHGCAWRKNNQHNSQCLSPRRRRHLLLTTHNNHVHPPEKKFERRMKLYPGSLLIFINPHLRRVMRRSSLFTSFFLPYEIHTRTRAVPRCINQTQLNLGVRKVRLLMCAVRIIDAVDSIVYKFSFVHYFAMLILFEFK